MAEPTLPGSGEKLPAVAAPPAGSSSPLSAPAPAAPAISQDPLGDLSESASSPVGIDVPKINLILPSASTNGASSPMEESLKESEQQREKGEANGNGALVESAIPVVADAPAVDVGEPGTISISTFVPTQQPPYAPPPEVIYPEARIPNPFANDMRPQPILETMAPNSLFRPEFLPADVDDRLDFSSIWIGVDNKSSRAVYFLTPTCLTCRHPAFAQHCDRSWPACQRCVSRGVTCIKGKAWGVMRPRTRRKSGSAASPVVKPRSITRTSELDSAAAGRRDKGKGKEVDAEGEHSEMAIDELPLAGSSQHGDVEMVEASGEEPTFSGTLSKKRSHSFISGSADGSLPPPSGASPNAPVPTLAFSTEDPTAKRPRHTTHSPSLPLPATTNASHLPLSSTDQRYFARLDANTRKAPLAEMLGPCPVWAKTRRSLQAAVEYLREPSKTAGASVDIGVGGIARGVILEGMADAQGIYWGQGDNVGTIMTSIGYSRRQRSIPMERPPSPLVAGIPPEPYLRPASPPLDILPQAKLVGHAAPQAIPDVSAIDEAPEIAALIMAQRARTPVAVAVAQDYTAVPFRVPRPYIVLGWFWITDAWLEPVLPTLRLFAEDQGTPQGPPERVIWKFRFQWCTGTQPPPWWMSPSSSPRMSEPASSLEQSWNFSGRGAGGDATVIPPLVRDGILVAEAFDEKYEHMCEHCKYVSRRVYSSGEICLNEKCSWFFGDAASVTNRIGPLTNRPGPCPPRAYIHPEMLGLQLRPAEPTADTKGRAVEVSQNRMGSEIWRGWVCGKCGLAQEKGVWEAWECEACSHTIPDNHRIYSHVALRPSRPVCIGPRQDDGYASWPIHIQHSWTLFADDVRVIRHVAGNWLGIGTEVHHALSSEETSERAAKVLNGLQDGAQVELRRCPAIDGNRRPANVTLSPFFTQACGVPAHPIPSLPIGPVTPWHKAAGVFWDTMELINVQSGRMFPGQQEFDSLLVAAYPPQLPASLVPRVVVEPASYTAFFFLGSDGSVRFRPADTRYKQGDLTVQHGDVVGIKAGGGPVEVTLKMDGFGFVAIARRASPPPAIPTGHRQAKPHVPQQPRPAPPHVAPAHYVAPTPPPKPKLPSEPPLTNWYIGGHPLDPKQPVRIAPAFRPAPPPVEPINGDTSTAEEGVEGPNSTVARRSEPSKIFLTIAPVPPRTVEPRGLSPLAGYGESTAAMRRAAWAAHAPPKRAKAEVVPVPAVAKKSVGKPAARGTRGPRASAASSVAGESSAGTPKGGRPRKKAAVKVEAAEDSEAGLDVEEDVLAAEENGDEDENVEDESTPASESSAMKKRKRRGGRGGARRGAGRKSKP
ncbi:hypothetical protein IAT38_000344 [Cryptococcus sp. DSM 104549]